MRQAYDGFYYDPIDQYLKDYPEKVAAQVEWDTYGLKAGEDFTVPARTNYTGYNAVPIVVFDGAMPPLPTWIIVSIFDASPFKTALSLLVSISVLL